MVEFIDNPAHRRSGPVGLTPKGEAVAVSVLWKNGAVTAGCSNTDSAKLALMVLALDAHQRRAFEGGD